MDDNTSLKFITVTPTCDTSAYGANDVLFDRTAIPGFARVSKGSAMLESLTVVDKDFQAAAIMTVFFLKANVTLGTANAAVSISDANATSIVGTVVIAAADWISLVGSRIALETLGEGTIYFAETTAGTPTQTAAGLVFTFGVSQ